MVVSIIETTVSEGRTGHKAGEKHRRFEVKHEKVKPDW